MPANSRWDLIRGLRVKCYRIKLYFILFSSLKLLNRKLSGLKFYGIRKPDVEFKNVFSYPAYLSQYADASLTTTCKGSVSLLPRHDRHCGPTCLPSNQSQGFLSRRGGRLVPHPIYVFLKLWLRGTLRPILLYTFS